MYKIINFTLFSIILFTTTSFADSLKLKNGNTIVGNIIEEKKDYVKIHSDFDMTLTYYTDEIEHIQKDPSPSENANEIPEFYIDKMNAIPDYPQTRVLNGVPRDQNKHCAPASIANALIWLDDNGYDNFIENSFNRSEDHIKLMNLLASKNYMNTIENGTTGKKLLLGLEKYIHKKGYTYKRLKYQGAWHVPEKFSTQQKIPQLEWIKKGLLGHSVVWLSIGYYSYNIFSDTYERKAGHLVTLVGYGKDPSGNIAPNYLIFHNPAYGMEGDFFSNDYVKMEEIKSGHFRAANNQRWYNAKGFHKLSVEDYPMHVKDTHVGILEDAIILEMPQPNNLTAKTHNSDLPRKERK